MKKAIYKKYKTTREAKKDKRISMVYHVNI